MRRAIEAHYATAADPKTVAQSSELYADDAVLEFRRAGSASAAGRTSSRSGRRIRRA
jgi:hypothetical protein